MQGTRQQWLGQYQETALAYAQQGYDQLQEYVKSNFNDYVEANNLTQVCCDMHAACPYLSTLLPGNKIQCKHSP